MQGILDFFNNYISWISLPDINIGSIFELILLTIILYIMVKWLKKSKAWSFIKGLTFLFLFYLFAYVFQLHVFLFIFENLVSIFLFGFLAIFAPEIRKALEDVGKHSFDINKFISFKNSPDIKQSFSDKSVEEMFEAIKIMSDAKTGALMVFEQEESLSDYDETGIPINADISKQLIINIFEHNTPLHDGALTLRNNKIGYATCYLPLSDNMSINKSLGTRHRAALGASENKDCYVIVVSEETGAVSYTHKGNLHHKISDKKLKELLNKIQNTQKIEHVSIENKFKKGVDEIVRKIKK